MPFLGSVSGAHPLLRSLRGTSPPRVDRALNVVFNQGAKYGRPRYGYKR